jgi:general secretion pathway protein F
MSSSARLIDRLLNGALPSRAAGAKPAAVDQERFAQDLSLLLNSGITLLESLRTLSERGRAGDSTLQLLVRQLELGEPLSAAMVQIGGFSPSLIACIKASEVTGDLPESLQRFAQNAATIRDLRGRVVGACVYPAILLSVGVLVVLFLLGFVVPRFAMVLESTSRDLPWASRVLIDLGRAVYSAQLPIALALIALVAGAVVWIRRRGSSWMLEAAAKVPWAKAYVRAFGQSQGTRSAAMLVRSGIPAIKALTMCRELWIPSDRARLDVALDAARSGAPLADAMHDSGVVDRLGHRMLKVAQQSGRLDLALDRLADAHDLMLSRGVENLSRVIEPLMMMIIGVVVGGIVVLMYLPIFQLASSVQ